MMDATPTKTAPGRRGRHSWSAGLLLLAVLTAGLAGRALLARAGEEAEIAAPTPEELVRGRLQQWFAAHPTGRIYIQLDKPLYKPGETIWFKTSLFETATLAPFPGTLGCDCQLVDPRGSTVVRKRLRLNDGGGENDFVVPDGVPGGEYTLKVNVMGGPTEERPVIISAYQAPLIQKELRVLGKAYGPGDRVEAKAEFRRGTGEALADTAIEGIVRVDGREVKRWTLKTDAEGKLLVVFDLPDKIDNEDGLLTLKVEQGGITESVSRGIPILLAKLNVDFFPEGGDLVAGLPGRVYFQALKPNGKPAEVAGVIVDNQGAEVAEVSSYHHGMGRVEFTPVAGRTYNLKVTRPVGITRSYVLPAAKADGVVMRLADDLTGQRADCRLTLYSSEARQDVVVVAALRERLVARRQLDLEPGANELALFPDSGQGVMRITVLDRRWQPLCERVVYRQQGRDLQISIKADKDHYMPREQVTLAIRTRLPNGTPAPAELCLSVVDDRVLTFADDKTAHLLSHLYLEKDLPGKIEEPNFYFDPEEEKAPLALELLMGTRGWRRFEWKRLDKPGAFEDIRVTDQIIREAAEQLAARLDAPRTRGGAVALGMVEEKLAKGMPMAARAIDAVLQKGAPVDVAAAELPAAPEREQAARAPRPVVAAKEKQLAAAAPPARPRLRQMADRAEAFAEIAADEEIAGEWRDAAKRRRARAPGWAMVRQFPLIKYDSTKADVRTDFRETILWQPRVVTGDDGRATVTFWLSDAVTAFRIRAEGTAKVGLPGREELVVDSRTPMHLEAKLPVVLSAGDRVFLPVRLGNETDAPLQLEGGVELPATLRAEGTENLLAALRLEANEARTVYLPMTAVVGKAGAIKLWAAAGGLKDTVSRPIRVEPVGFPYQEALSDTVKETHAAAVELPEGIVEGSLSGTLKFYPSPMATMLDGLASILREPCGCFEQTSSSTYPNIMVLNYLRQSGANLPEVEKRAHELIRKGYQRLTGFECKQKGYEWFGGDPGHEALTAYGLMEFIDMAKVFDGVDQEMIGRTARWMLAQRDGNGGFKRNPRALDSFGRAAPEVTDAYIVWALSEAGIEGLDREFERVTKLAYEAKNPYITALTILARANRNPKDPEAKELAGTLLAAKQKDGSYQGVGRSITGSSGQQLSLETTSLAVLAMLRTGRPAASLNDSVGWLIQQRRGGGFGCTQSTILVLKALTEYAEASRQVTSDGDIVVRVNGNVAARRHFSKGDQGVIEIEGVERFLRSGKNDVDLQLVADMELPWSLDISYKTAVPASSKATPVRLQTRLAATKVALGETLAVTCELENTSDEGQGMTLVRLGIPAGLRPQLWQLKELRENGQVDFYETTAREVIFYYRSLAPKAKRQVKLDLRADLPGSFTGIASSAYLYYNPGDKWWNAPLQASVQR